MHPSRASHLSESVVDSRSRSSLPFLRDRWLAAGLLLAALADLLLLHWARLSIAVSVASVGYALAGVIAMAARYSLRAPATRQKRIARDLIEGMLVFVAICLLGAVASYPLATISHGFVDKGLESVDAAVHFHWLFWYELVASHAWLQAPERAAYLSIYCTPAVLITAFAATGRRSEMHRFLASYWLAAILTLCFFPFVPAAGPFATLWHGNAPYMPLSALYQDEVIVALRHHAVQTVDLGSLHGLVCAPSFHAASAVLYIAAGWRIAWLRWPIVALNVAMLLATPIEGTHYLVDIVMGMVVALFALLVTPRLIKAAEGAGRISPTPAE